MGRNVYTCLMLLLLSLASCAGEGGRQNGNNGTEAPAVKPVAGVPVFSADSAYHFIEEQLSFGPRVPNSNGHKECGDYLVQKLKAYGADVIEQEADLTAYNGDVLHARNIIARFQPGKKERLLLCAHWDTRPWADSDPDSANHYKPYPGANDGGSGVGVLLEVARQLSLSPTTFGIDIVLFDAEDYGRHSAETSFISGNGGWALGSGYWARNPHEGYSQAKYGILLDLVGAPNSRFCIEGNSYDYAENIVSKVWRAASDVGFSGYFPFEFGGQVTDDHIDVNEILGVRCIDIINYDPESPNGFGPYHHTMKDDMDWIDKHTLKAVGQTVLQVIYNEK